MAEKPNPFDLVRIVCIAAGIMIAMIVVRVAFDFGPILGGALGGGIGALLGLGLYALVTKIRQK